MNPGRLDLDEESRRALDLDAVLDWIAGHAGTEPGARRLRATEPRAEPAWITEEFRAIQETMRCVDDGGRLVPRRVPDPDPGLAGLRVVERALDAETLRDLAAALEAASGVRERLLGLSAGEQPLLRRIGAAMPDLRREARGVLRSIEPDGRISDEASAELRRVRKARARVAERLRETLTSFVHDPGTREVLRDDFVTQRNGRYVIPVRTDTHRPVQGIVHATSSSGATRFVEPLPTVEMNNELVELDEREAAEEQRVLIDLSERLRARLDEVDGLLDGLTRIDTLEARASFAAATEAIVPVFTADATFRLRDARHPLLDRRLRESGERVVPLGLELLEDDRVLLISGPNAGGKTVALKTLGLIVLMAQSGVPVPAREATLPVFHQLRADIGDHQSIHADLSTFSAHMSSVVRYLEEIRSPALLLFDEIGTGTEPAEGAALAQTILEALATVGATTVATTHLGSLKAWAFTTDGAASAAMEFDEEALRPTYRVLMGAAGVSAGLEIAARLGLDAALVERARARLGETSRTGEAYMERLRQMMGDLEERAARMECRESEQEEDLRQRESRARGREERLEHRATTGLDAVLREFRDLARRELARARDKAERKRLERELAAAQSGLRRVRSERVQEFSRGGQTVPDAPPQEIREGVRVWVRSLGREGKVRSVRGDKVEVELGRVAFTVARDDLREPTGAPEPQRKRQVPAAGPPPPAAGSAVAAELKLIGKRVEEALEELDRYLDAAVVDGLPEVRIVHGHGTGKLRKAVRAHLTGHPQVRQHRPGGPGEGGDGATVARLRV